MFPRIPWSLPFSARPTKQLPPTLLSAQVLRQKSHHSRQRLLQQQTHNLFLSPLYFSLTHAHTCTHTHKHTHAHTHRPTPPQTYTHTHSFTCCKIKPLCLTDSSDSESHWENFLNNWVLWTGSRHSFRHRSWNCARTGLLLKDPQLNCCNQRPASSERGESDEIIFFNQWPEALLPWQCRHQQLLCYFNL